MLRELDLRGRDPDRVFINVLEIADTPYSETGFLRRYDWVGLTQAENREQQLNDVASRLHRISSAGISDANVLGQVRSSFRNRTDELERVFRGVTNAAGPHFWLVIAPPQLGKTWFLNQLSIEVAREQNIGVPAVPGSDGARDHNSGRVRERGSDVNNTSSEAKRWVIRLVDIRQQPPEVRGDPAAILALLFGRTSPSEIDRNPSSIATEIVRIGRPHLCLLDSAELLPEDTASVLRSSLSSIYQSIQGAGADEDVRLAVVVASRQEHQWSGVAPEPRLSTLALTEFGIDIVQQALRHLARQMGRKSFSQTYYRQAAASVYRLSEGLPALLMRCLQQIQVWEWVNVHRLDQIEVFEEIAHPYVMGDLLSSDSLFPLSQEPRNTPEAELRHAVLERTFRILAPYRLFTQSHLRHYIDSDADFNGSLQDLDWTVQDLWQSVSDTALLKRPPNEIWQELHKAIRRLLFRYYYSSRDERAEAHHEARAFMKVWADKQVGKEQVMGLAECMWHEASELDLYGTDASDMERALSESAQKLSMALTESSAYSLPEVRNFAANVIRNDVELQEIISHIDRLSERLAAIVAAPQ